MALNQRPSKEKYTKIKFNPYNTNNVFMHNSSGLVIFVLPSFNISVYIIFQRPIAYI